MESKDEFVFSQEDLMVSSFSVFCGMKETGELSDVSIRIDNRIFSAHRIILSAAIPYFHAMFASKLVETKEKEITLKELDPAALESLINFAYTGKVKITAENVQSLLIASEFLQLVQVRDSCCDFISKRLDPGNMLEVRAFAGNLNCISLVQNADFYISQNFDDFRKTEEFLSLPFPFLNELIRRDDLRVESEEEVFEAAISWAEIGEERHSSLKELLTGIRLMFLTPEFLKEKAYKEKLIVDSIPCRNLLDEAERYLFVPVEMLRCSFSTSERCYEGMYIFNYRRSTGLEISKYASDTGKWNTLLRDKTGGYLCYVLAVGNHFYLFTSGKVFERYNPLTRQWTPLPQYPEISSLRKYVVSSGNRIYMFRSGDWSSNVACFDPQQNKWLLDQDRVVFSDGVLVSSGQNIYILGGFFTSHEPYDSRTNKMYNPRTGEVTQIPEMCHPRTVFGCAALDGSIYVCGGVGSSPPSAACVLKSTEVYSTSDGQWRAVSPMNTARRNFSLIAFKKKLYAVGGDIKGATPSIECYDPVTRKWSFVCALEDRRSYYNNVVVTSAKD